MRSLGLLALALSAAACRGEAPAPAPAPPPAAEAWPEAPAGPLPPAVRESRTVVVVAVDGLRADHLRLFGHPHATTPNLEALAAESLVLGETLADSTAGGSALTSLLVGASPLEHRMGSLREAGAAILPEAAVTLAERFRAAGWTTLASVALPSLAPELCGLDQGFDRYLAPDWSEGEVRPARQAYHLLAGPLERALEQDEPVLALLHLADPRARRPAEGPLGARFLAAHLAPFRERLGESLAARLDGAEDDPEAVHEALREALGRGRGSPQHAAWRAALYDGQMAQVDLHLGLLLELLERHGRRQEATVVVVGLRGNALDARPADTAPALRPEEVRTALVLRLPGAARSGLLAVRAQPRDVAPTLVELLLDDGGERSLLPWLRGEREDPRPAWILAGDLSYLALHGSELALECDARLEPRWIDRASWSFRAQPPAGPEAGDLARRVAELSPATEVRLELHGGGPGELELDWRLHGGYCLERRLAGGASEVRRGAGADVAGRALLAGGGASIAWVNGRREQALELTLSGSAGLEGRLWVGERALVHSLLPRVPHPDGAPWPDDPEAGEPAPLVDYTHRGDVWWRLAVGEEARGRRVEAVVALFPPEKAEDRLDWAAGPEVQVEPLPGRLDALLLRGTAPLVVDLSKETQRDVALAVLLDGEAVDPARVRYRGRALAPPDALRLYLPDWMPGVTDALHGPPPDPPPAGSVVLLRRDWSPAPAGRRGLPADQLEAVRRLGAFE